MASSPPRSDSNSQDGRVLNKFGDLSGGKPPSNNIETFEDMERKEHIQKFKKYKADFTSYLKAKYFSGKDIYGGAIFDKKETIDGMVIKASRLPATQSFTDSSSSNDESINSSDYGAETPNNFSNGKHSSKKSG